MKIRTKRKPSATRGPGPPTLEIQKLGQIQQATLEFGDLTVFVGPQATGKSIALQLLKFMVDTGRVQAELRRYGIDWSGKVPDLFDVYFGEGMRSLWKPGQTVIRWNDAEVDLEKIARHRRKSQDEKLFFVPAQRVLALRDGWPRPFTDYSPGDPFAVREFSEQLRGLAETEFSGESLFPQTRRLKKEFRQLLERDVFSNYSLKVDKLRSQKRLVLGGEETENLPYMVWSAGQREFVPLLLGFYWLMPPTKVSRRSGIEWVVIEELEMGLHPRAISVVLLMVFELVARGYRVCLSTHASQVLDAMWTLKHLGENGGKPDTLLEVFAAPKTPAMLKVAETVMAKTFKVHYFDRESGTTRDISALDPGAEEDGELGWGGLSEFSGRANDAVARAVANPRN